jgi:acyl carrier protein
MNMLLQFPEAPEALQYVQHILLGGEALSITLVNELRKLTSATMYNMYGPTETTIWSSISTLPVDSSRIDLGQPIANTQLYILDRELQPVPIGVAGELYISGDGVARGYLKRPELTAERFLPNPWSGARSARMYRTGDLARYRGDGSIEYLGRIDHQIKLRGFRIELGEIETALREHEEIKEAVVLLHDDNEVDATLVAYISPLTTLTVSPEQLRAYLGRFLPAYMVPGVIIELATFPLTPNGKIDRQALPDPDREQRMVGTAFVPPQTELQEQLAEIWYQLLKLSHISIYDNFFDLGGHSLLITRLAARIRNTFEVNIPLRDLFEAPTIELMASRIEQCQLELFEQAGDESLKQMLSSLEDLSEDEIHLLLEPSE